MYRVLKIMHMLNFLDTFSVGVTLLTLALWLCKSFLEIEWPLTLAFDSDLGNKFNLSNQARDRSLLGYDIGINVILKSLTVPNSLKRLRGCYLRGEF